MTSNRIELATTFGQLADEELMRRLASGDLTESAHAVALAEASCRGLSPLAVPTAVPAMSDPAEYHGDMQLVARHLTATEAHLLKSCLEAGGVPAEVGDANLVQAHAFLAAAVGGASLRVPQAFVAEALELIEAFQRGDFALGEDFEEGGT